MAGWHINMAKTVSTSTNHVNSPIAGDCTRTHKKSLWYKGVKQMKSRTETDEDQPHCFTNYFFITIIPMHCIST